MSINRFGRPFSIPTRYAGAIRTSRSTPILQPITPRAGFEDEDDDEDEDDGG
jgi:hypothetical protein